MPEAAADIVRHELNLPATADKAFRVFALDLARWWPREFTWSQDTLADIGIEGAEGGACYEVGPHGFRCDWGRVLHWEPPRRLELSWQISADRVPEPDPAKASEVLVRFEPHDPGSCSVILEHRAFRRHGDRAEEYRTGMDKGWAYLLGCYAAAVRYRVH
jgi:uncharacterized protein YndB with AHSA1/START domain